MTPVVRRKPDPSWRSETRQCQAPGCENLMSAETSASRKVWERRKCCSTACGAALRYAVNGERDVIVEKPPAILVEWPAWARFEDDPRAAPTTGVASRARPELAWSPIACALAR